ncbi:MAG TPA: hypothetical protein VKR30_05865 [Candidatus Limnocylindrales bacterium]|nr:hypothetical protein [Candidatus Limnocylindrales bacterium]
MAAALAAFVVAGCGQSPGSTAGGSTTPFPTIPENVNPGQLPGSNPACQQASAPVQGIGQIEAGLRSGSMSDAAAETQVLGIQQFLVQVQQQLGAQSAIGTALQNVVYQLGELGTQLNQNAAIDAINPVLANVDSAVQALGQACAAG